MPRTAPADCRSKEVIDLRRRWTSSGKLKVAGARGPMDDLTIRLHARRPAHPLLFDRHRLRGRHARPDRHRNAFQALCRAAVDAAGQYAGKTLKYLHVDSYETGADVLGQQPTWSAKFLDEFRDRRGYDPLPYLPAMVLVASAPARAEEVPVLNVEPVCQGIAEQAATPGERGGPDLTFRQCMKNEQSMREQIVSQWSTFTDGERSNCVAEAKLEVQSSYTDLLTCLQMAKDARQFNQSPDAAERIEQR